MRLINLVIFLLSTFTIINSQPDSRFRPFDWVLYHGPGEIKSLSEGYNYIYIATKNGGIKRFNIYSLTFDEPITIAQGLESNNVSAIHFDSETGYIWAATPNHIQYSFSREGDWFSIEIKSLGLSDYDEVKKIGSSVGYIWIQLRSSYAKLSHSSGSLVGIYSIPDEVSINWSSGPFTNQNELSEIFMNYSISDGWIYSGNDLIDPLGRRVTMTTGFIGKYGNVYAGTDDGTFFHASEVMQNFTPMIPDITNFAVSSMYKDGDKIWIGSPNYVNSKGISWTNPWSKQFGSYLFEETINMTPTPIFSLTAEGDELWAGGDNLLLFYDQKKDYWRTFGEEIGIPSGQLWSLHRDDSHIWVGSSNGISRISRSTKREDPIGIEYIFHENPIYDIEEYQDDIWIGARSGIFVYSKSSPQLKNGMELGRKSFAENMIRITAIKEHNGEMYVVGDMGIAKFDFDKSEWELLFNSVTYQSRTVYSLALKKNNIFLGTDDGIVRINQKTGFIKDYSFSFIGQVNEIIVEDKVLWAATNNGLIKFKWKRDL